MLQCVAVCFSVLQCNTISCNVVYALMPIAPIGMSYCSVLQSVAVCCRVLQSLLQSVAVCCNDVFQCVAVLYSMLQRDVVAHALTPIVLIDMACCSV